jgi:pilus assembly protein CpaB
MRNNSRAVLFLIAAVVSAVAAVFVTRQWVARQAPVPLPDVAANVETQAVVVADSDMSAGAAILERNVRLVAWPKEYLPSGSFTSPQLVDARVLKRAIKKNEPILESSLLPQGAEAGLSALISDGKRAMSVKVDAVVGVAGFVKPGARVDVIATVRRVDQSKSLPYTRVILQDLKVLAIDQTLEETSAGDADVVNVVTLEVDPTQSQKLAYAASEGTLQLALRNPQDYEEAKLASITVGDVVPGPPAAVRQVQGETVEQIRGTAKSDKSL